MTWPGLNSSLSEPALTVTVVVRDGADMKGCTRFKSTTYNETLDIEWEAPIWIRKNIYKLVLFIF